MYSGIDQHRIDASCAASYSHIDEERDYYPHRELIEELDAREQFHWDQWKLEEKRCFSEAERHRKEHQHWAELALWARDWLWGEKWYA